MLWAFPAAWCMGQILVAQFVTCHDVHGVALLCVEGHTPCFGPFSQCVEVRLELHVVLMAVDSSVEQSIVSKESDARPGVYLGCDVIDKNDEKQWPQYTPLWNSRCDITLFALFPVDDDPLGSSNEKVANPASQVSVYTAVEELCH